ncbi:hypothetical protein O0I10_002018 [Lichtheimia ornata]|uniref:CCHC-type domain-containing protein n=1 Tax=Lichtheimia ornata TaxID=688661 RepID=A0AAD7VB27_9FUNG|nr:uncharacterized protein O0I10_002018 [Lichtheimia ornata]KAJ8662324.1 hypothetical protein O0I10_002018 [Lichtheimia ornata]
MIGAHQEPSVNRDNRMNQEPPRCYNCGGLGHLQRSCPSTYLVNGVIDLNLNDRSKHLKDEATYQVPEGRLIDATRNPILEMSTRHLS